MDRKHDADRRAVRKFLTRFISPTRIGFVKIGLSMMTTSSSATSSSTVVNISKINDLLKSSAPQPSQTGDRNNERDNQRRRSELSEEEEILQRLYEQLVSSDKKGENDSLLALQRQASADSRLLQQQTALRVREQELLSVLHTQVFSGQLLSGRLQAQSQQGTTTNYWFDGKRILATEDNQSQSGMLSGKLQPIEQDASAQSYTLQATLQPLEQDTPSSSFSMEGALQPIEQDSPAQSYTLSGKLQPLEQDDHPESSCQFEASLQPICPDDGIQMKSLSGSLQLVESITPEPERSNKEH